MIHAGLDHVSMFPVIRDDFAELVNRIHRAGSIADDLLLSPAGAVSDETHFLEDVALGAMRETFAEGQVFTCNVLGLRAQREPIRLELGEKFL